MIFFPTSDLDQNLFIKSLLENVFNFSGFVPPPRRRIYLFYRYIWDLLLCACSRTRTSGKLQTMTLINYPANFFKPSNHAGGIWVTHLQMNLSILG